ncbi:MAG: hypothetical protein F4Y10_02440, partial [Synechococcus sp. SB0663_bin_10]|nr:hypothetical protein [Synechococcus sp. SB0663_bin_10]
MPLLPSCAGPAGRQSRDLHQHRRGGRPGPEAGHEPAGRRQNHRSPSVHQRSAHWRIRGTASRRGVRHPGCPAAGLTQPRRPLQQLFLTDPLSRLRPAKDSSVALMQAARTAGSQVWWAEPLHLQALDGDITVLAQPLELAAMDHTPQGWQAPDPWYRQGAPEQRSLKGFQVVWMRRDPPVDDGYTFAAGLLAQAERRGVRVINRPASLLIWNEKLSALQFPQLMAPTTVAADCTSLLAFIHQHQDVVLKPLAGKGGQGVVRASSAMAGLKALLELVTAQQQLPVLA